MTMSYHNYGHSTSIFRVPKMGKYFAKIFEVWSELEVSWSILRSFKSTHAGLAVETIWPNLCKAQKNGRNNFIHQRNNLIEQVVDQAAKGSLHGRTIAYQVPFKTGFNAEAVSRTEALRQVGLSSPYDASLLSANWALSMRL